jgi:hypothetical protein
MKTNVLLCMGAVAAASLLAGCGQTLTVVDNDAAHLRRGQQVKFMSRKGGERYIVVAVENPDAPPHAWQIEPYTATRESDGSYILRPLVPGAAHSPGDTHAIKMTIVSQDPLEVELRADPHASGGDHGGTVHLR